jgi:hypothetical protein
VNLALLLPAGLAALAAALLPLLIHLARRSEHRPTVFAALQWLRRKPKPRHRIRFDEWPLLLVRLLLLVLLALLLARPVLTGAHDDAPRVAVAPGAEPPADRASIAPPDARWLRLAPGFPALDAGVDDATAPVLPASITSLLRELDASLPPGVALTVLVPAVLDGVDAQRPVLGRAVDWRVVPSVPDSDAPAVSRQAAPPPLAVRFAPGREPALRYVRAALAAWQPAPGERTGDASRTPDDIAPITAPLTDTVRNLVWLAPGAVPPAICDWIRAGGTALLDAQATPCDPVQAALAVWRDEAGGALVEAAAQGRGRMLRFTRPLDPQSMPVLLEPTLPARLRALFGPAPPAPARVAAADHAPLPGGPAFPQPPREMQGWLVVLIALLFLVERVMATGRRQGAGP